MAVNREKALTAAAKFASKGQHDRAAKEYISIIEADPSDVRSWLLLAEALVNAGDKTGALERYLHVGKHYAETADPQKAIAVYRKVLGIDPNRLDIQTAIASLYKDLGRNADAVAAYEFVAQAYFQAGQIAEGLEGFRMVAELEPAAVGKRLRLAELYSREGMVAQAVEHFRLAAERLFADRRTDDYIRVAERLIYHKEDDLPVLRSLAQIYLKQGENRRALVKLNALLRAAPADAEGLELLGETFVAIGKTDKAISVVMELAREQRKGGRKAKETAARVLRKALGWNPENAEDIKKTAGEIETEIAALPPEPKEAQSRDEDISLDVDVVEDEVGAEGPDLDLDVDVDEEEERKVEEVPSRPFAPVDANVVESGEDSVGDVEKVLLEARVYVRYKMFEHALGHLDTVFVREADHIAALELQAQILTELVRNAEAADTHVRLAQLASGRDPKLAREHLGRAQALVPDHNRAEMVLAALDSGEAGVAEAAPLLRGLQANLNGDPETEARTFDPGQSSSRNALVDPDAVAAAEQTLRTEASANDAGKPEPTQAAEATPESVVVASEPPQAAEAAEPVVVASEPDAAVPVGTDVKDAAREVSGASKPTETSGARPLRPLARESSGARRQSGEATTEGSGARRLPTEVITEGSGARRLPTEVITEGSGARRLPTETTPAPISPLIGRFGEKTPHPSRLGDKTPLPSFKPPPPADATTRPASVAESGEQKPLPSFKGPPSRSTASPTSPEPDAEGPRPTKPTRKPPGTSFKPPPKATPTRPSAEVEEVEAEVEELDVDEVVEPAPLPKKGPPVRPKPQPPGRRPPPSKPASSKPSTSESADALPATEPAVETSPANETSPDRPTAEASSTASDAKPEVAAEAKPEVAAEPEVVTELETKPEVAAEPESKPEVAAEPEAATEPESKPEVTSESETKPEVTSEPAEPEVTSEPETKPEVASEPAEPEVASEPESKPEVISEPAEPEAEGAAAPVAADESMSTDWPDITDEVEELRFFISGRFDDDAQFAYLELQRRFPGHPVLTEFAERFTAGPRLESAAAPVTLEDATPAATPAIGDAPATVFPLEDEDEDSFLSSIFDEPVAPVGSKAAPRRAVATLDDGADAQTFFDLGTAYREMGLLDDALSQFDLAARDNRWTSRARVMMASLRVQRGENDLALADLQTAIDSATDQDEQSEARYELGVLYQALGDNERAIAILQAVAPGYRDRDERLTMLGV